MTPASGGFHRTGCLDDRNIDAMKVTSRGLLRTTLISSTAGLMLGVPLLSTIPARLRGGERQPQTQTLLVKGQPQTDGGALTRLFGSRTDTYPPANVATDLNSNAAPQVVHSSDGRLFGNFLARGDGGQSQSSGQQVPSAYPANMTRSQARFMRRNPYAAKLMMLRQQQLLLEQQQAVQEQYEEEAIPDDEVFDSLDIDIGEWADAPGRNVTSDSVPANSLSKPWWETGDSPVGGRRRRDIEFDDPALDQHQDQPQAPAPVAPLVEAPVQDQIPDLFPSEPNLAPSSSTESIPFPSANAPAAMPTPAPLTQAPSAPAQPTQTVPAPAPQAQTAPTAEPQPETRTAELPNDGPLTFPETPAALVPAPTPTPPAPAEQTPVTAVPAPSQPELSSQQLAPFEITDGPVESSLPAAAPAVIASESSSPDNGPADFIPPEPDAFADTLPGSSTGSGEPLAFPPMATEPTLAPPVPAAPDTPVVPDLPGQFAASEENDFVPSAPAPTVEAPALTESGDLAISSSKPSVSEDSLESAPPMIEDE
ncbi:MAG: hypothetical protein KDA75_19200, partial [Planctomycetaceae bacterium]|nr:hypothetical protein [Planctomycetaceae bacterium]